MRDNLKLTMESPNTNIGRQPFRHRSAIVWNNIPQWIKNIEDYHKFKCKLRVISVAVGNISFNDSVALGYILRTLVFTRMYCNQLDLILLLVHISYMLP